MSAQYICKGAIIKCSYGSAVSKLQVLPDRTVALTEENYGNVADHDSMVHIMPFGLCSSMKFPATNSATRANYNSLTPMPCNPGTMTLWENGNDSYLVRRYPALQSTSYCRCIYGGIITIVNDGQSPKQYELEKNTALQKEDILPQETANKNDDYGIDAVDFVPVVGSLRDIQRGLVAGSMGMVAFGAVFLVLDVAGFFTAGTANVGITAIKTSAKAGLKTTAKVVAKNAVNQGGKKLLEETSKKVSEYVLKPQLGQLVEKKLAEETFEELGKTAMKNAGPNIFKIGTETAKTGAKETAKTPKAEQQVVEAITDKVTKSVEKMTKQITEASKIGKEWGEHGMRQIKKYLGNNEINQGLIKFSKDLEKIENLRKDISRLEKITKY